MVNATRSITVFGIFLAVAGLLFFFTPNLILSVLGFPATTEVWIRLTGPLVRHPGDVFPLQRALRRQTIFRATNFARLIFFAGVTTLVILRLTSPLLVVFGMVDLAGAA